MIQHPIALAVFGMLCVFGTHVVGGEPRKLAIAETPADNPLKGLVPYADAEVERFPHSLEFDYIRFADVMIGPNQFDWKPLETRLDKIELDLLPDGRGMLKAARPAGTLDGFVGLLAGRTKKIATIEEIGAASAKGYGRVRSCAVRPSHHPPTR